MKLVTPGPHPGCELRNVRVDRLSGNVEDDLKSNRAVFRFDIFQFPFQFNPGTNRGNVDLQGLCADS